MDLLERRARVHRLLVALALGVASGVAVVWAFAQVLDDDRSNAPAFFAAFTWTATCVLVTIGVNALLAAIARRRWRLPIPPARVVRR